LDAGFNNALWLVKNGVPYDVAFNMGEADILAHMIVFASFEGTNFDWRRMRWEPKE